MTTPETFSEFRDADAPPLSRKPTRKPSTPPTSAGPEYADGAGKARAQQKADPPLEHILPRVQEMLKRHPCNVTPTGLRIHADATLKQQGALLRVLVNQYKASTLWYRVAIGQAYNSVPDSGVYGEKKAWVIDTVGKGAYQEVRNIGRVVSKWTEEEFSLGLPWSIYEELSDSVFNVDRHERILDRDLTTESLRELKKRLKNRDTQQVELPEDCQAMLKRLAKAEGDAFAEDLRAWLRQKCANLKASQPPPDAAADDTKSDDTKSDVGTELPPDEPAENAPCPCSHPANHPPSLANEPAGGLEKQRKSDTNTDSYSYSRIFVEDAANTHSKPPSGSWVRVSETQEAL